MSGSRLARLLRRVAGTRPAAAPPPEQWTDQLAAAGVTVDAWLRQRCVAGRLYADLPDARVARLRARFPASVARTRAAADRICRHEFDLLGSGPYVPRDASRRRRENGYEPIDWAIDPVSRLRFPEGFPHATWTPQMRPGLADIKLPWELGRCQHWVTLGQAYRLTAEERFGAEILRQHDDFLEVNPIGTGVQYTCTMDVAIRAFNWAIAFELIRSSPAMNGAALARAYRSLFDLGVFIERNLENKYEVTSNHFLSNIVGLYALGLIFSDLGAGVRWRRACRDWVEQEMQTQVLPDGADYESSVPYHRLVLELFLSGARLAALDGQPLSESYRDSLRRMADFMFAVLRPDGLLPQVGDADDGRLHIFSDYGTWRPQDPRHLAAPAALMLGEPSWLDVAGEDGLWEAAWWGCDIETAPGPLQVTPPARIFPAAGIFVARTDRSYLLVTNGCVGTNGFGNHKHNDLLGFEFHGGGEPLIVDAGSFVYTSDPDARNLFRSTAYHNTLQIDGAEQNDLRPDYLFRLFQTSAVEHVAFDVTPECITYTGRHTGFERLPMGVLHERTWRLHLESGALQIVDRPIGTGRHDLRWHFHFAPDVDVIPRGAGEFALATRARRWRLRAPADLAAAVADVWYSPSYGVRVPCRALDFTATADVSEASYTFTLDPDEGPR